ncbi:MAG TPA: glycosyltransferase family 4 protein [Burkholderiales bacterium]|nr:glycosyltransferase family 4 protein [Burkholderiales bacterium]
MKKLLFIDNTAHHLYTQEHLYSNFLKNGYKIILCCPNDNNYFSKLIKAGYHCENIDINSKSINPLKDVILLINLYSIIKKIKPSLIFSFTIKPNIYTSLICKILKIEVVPNITGLGYIFTKKNILTKFVLYLYKFAFSKLKFIFFQNSDDKNKFIENKILKSSTKIIQIPGSGVDLSKFYFTNYSNENQSINFLYSGRLLWDKGIDELIKSFRILKQRYKNIQLTMIGNFYHGNPSAINEAQILSWQNELNINYLGMVNDVPKYIAEADCIILPSYSEGMPRAILEGSSMGKVVITTDAVGCKDSVEHEITGFICKTKDVNSLVKAMEKFINLPCEQKKQLGLNGRKKMELQFDQKIVINEYFNVIKTLNIV